MSGGTDAMWEVGAWGMGEQMQSLMRVQAMGEERVH